MVDERKRAAQELIAGIYGQLCSLRDAKKEATAIVLPPDTYRLLQEYRNNLGEVPAGLPDYLGRYDLFGIPLYTDQGTNIVIKSRRSKNE